MEAAEDTHWEIDECGDSVRYRLPCLCVPYRVVGAVLGVIVGSLFVAGLRGVFDATGIAEVLGSGFFVLFGGTGVLISLFLVVGRSCVELTAEDFVAELRLGPLRWRQARPIAALRRIVAKRMDSEGGGREGHGYLRAEFEGYSAIRTAPFHLPSILDALARDLAERTGIAATRSDEPAVLTIADRDREECPDQDRVEAPEQCRARLEQNEYGLLFTLPPRGVLRDPRFWWALGWTGLSSLPLFVAGRDRSDVPYAVVLTFLAIGLLMLLLSIRSGRQRARVVVADDTLVLERRGFFRPRRQRWDREEIAAIRVRDTGVREQQQAILAVQIEPKRGRSRRFAAGHSGDELRWIATTLRAALGLASPGSGGGQGEAHSGNESATTAPR